MQPRKLLPTRTQWRGFSAPEKATIIGTVIGIIALIISMLPLFQRKSLEPTTPTISQSSSGPQSPNIANVRGNVDIKSTAVTVTPKPR